MSVRVVRDPKTGNLFRDTGYCPDYFEVVAGIEEYVRNPKYLSLPWWTAYKLENEVILGVDASGNFIEGKGTTGLALVRNGEIVEVDDVKAKGYKSREEYWHAIFNKIINLIRGEYGIVVCEEYRLYHHKGQRAESQAHSILETPQFIGALTYNMWNCCIPVVFQSAAQVKTRWKDEILVKKGFLQQKGSNYYFKNIRTNLHMRDAIRHALHYWRYGMKVKQQ